MAFAACVLLVNGLFGERGLMDTIRARRTYATARGDLDRLKRDNEALRHGVTFTPGAATMVEPGPQTSMRLSFGLLDPDELDEGVRRLAMALRAVRRYDRLGATAPVS